MKLVVRLLVFCSILFGCQSNNLPTEQISTVSVVRETPSNNHVTQAKTSRVTAPSSTYQRSKARYHIIVASYSAGEKARAQAFVTKIKAMNYPASILYSSQRYRVSIESFASEVEAKTARDEYRKALDQKGIWVHKVEN